MPLKTSERSVENPAGPVSFHLHAVVVGMDEIARGRDVFGEIDPRPGVERDRVERGEMIVRRLRIGGVLRAVFGRQRVMIAFDLGEIGFG